ncbi:hypothetical protein IAQ61_003426 [Plenodomus lingam]|uniref:Predicted protein n=1 Tax=Leptosphaeria maculans (strain JN3 / isolate v23.1.3 / race Av1-4-5-6-7-8) TaxID=985895 RepID=E5AEH1_LEPMJ|nr:predicted protein [Plenodomus lingam JN3]KAH9875961.1 hypothetical protein IAQ61_003426 [Plenodomus lingam]CBY01610.1 predicted protein [Plenodomus lingam JN3]
MSDDAAPEGQRPLTSSNCNTAGSTVPFVPATTTDDVTVTDVPVTSSTTDSTTATNDVSAPPIAAGNSTGTGAVFTPATTTDNTTATAIVSTPATTIDDTTSTGVSIAHSPSITSRNRTIILHTSNPNNSNDPTQIPPIELKTHFAIKDALFEILTPNQYHSVFMAWNTQKREVHSGVRDPRTTDGNPFWLAYRMGYLDHSGVKKGYDLVKKYEMRASSSTSTAPGVGSGGAASGIGAPGPSSPRYAGPSSSTTTGSSSNAIVSPSLSTFSGPPSTTFYGPFLSGFGGASSSAASGRSSSGFAGSSSSTSGSQSSSRFAGPSSSTFTSHSLPSSILPSSSAHSRLATSTSDLRRPYTSTDLAPMSIGSRSVPTPPGQPNFAFSGRSASAFPLPPTSRFNLPSISTIMGGRLAPNTTNTTSKMPMGPPALPRVAGISGLHAVPPKGLFPSVAPSYILKSQNKREAPQPKSRSKRSKKGKEKATEESEKIIEGSSTSPVANQYGFTTNRQTNIKGKEKATDSNESMEMGAFLHNDDDGSMNTKRDKGKGRAKEPMIDLTTSEPRFTPSPSPPMYQRPSISSSSLIPDFSDESQNMMQPEDNDTSWLSHIINEGPVLGNRAWTPGFTNRSWAPEYTNEPQNSTDMQGGLWEQEFDDEGQNMMGVGTWAEDNNNQASNTIRGGSWAQDFNNQTQDTMGGASWTPDVTNERQERFIDPRSLLVQQPGSGQYEDFVFPSGSDVDELEGFVFSTGEEVEGEEGEDIEVGVGAEGTGDVAWDEWTNDGDNGETEG